MTDEARDAANLAFVEDVQAVLVSRGRLAKVDRWAGDDTRAALGLELGADLTRRPPAPRPPPERWPGRSEAEIRAVFGPPGESQQVRIDSPYPMVIAWDLGTPLRKITCHRLVAESLAGVLEALRDKYGMEWITDHGLHLYGGCYNFRKMRGGASWSTHAWGIAIDLDPARNGLRTPWPAKAAMPVEAIELFEAAGWTSLARVIGRDAMHFQATGW